MATNNSSQQRLLIIAGIIIATLLVTNAALLCNKYSQDSLVDSQTSKLEEADKLKIELEKQYQEALSELEEMRGSNEELNAIIDQQKEELKQQKNKIDALLREGKEVGKVVELILSLLEEEVEEQDRASDSKCELFLYIRYLYLKT